MPRIILVMMLMTGLDCTAHDEPECDKQQAVAKALESFSGSWEIVKMSPAGATQGAKRILFKRDGTYAAVDEEGNKLWAGMFEIDPTASPNMWDHRSRGGTEVRSDVVGIYELGADSLKMACVVGHWRGKEWVGKCRPKNFDPRVADVVIEMKRGTATASLAHQ